MGSREPTKGLTADERLADALAGFRADPLGYVMFAFPWDSEPSIQVVELAQGVEEAMTDADRARRAAYRARFPGCTHGPDLWACDFLEQLGQEIRRRGFDGRSAVEPIQFATVSGHEIGKSALCAWLIKFILDTRPFSKGTVTAVTDEQLRTKTWAEVGKWHHLSITRHWFKYTSARGSMTLTHADERFSGTWRCDARTCRKEKSEAFAGQHAPTATSFYIFDEASGIDDKIFEVRTGGLTSGEPMVFDFGNGTVNSGAFYEECEGRLKHRFIVRSIDSRTVAITNKAAIAREVADFGEDSDRVRVRVRGMFPVRGYVQFMPTEEVRAAMERETPDARLYPVVLGVDVARFGDDRSVVWARRGMDARTFGPRVYSGLDTVQLAGVVTAYCEELARLGCRPTMICVDEGGIGGGVVDQLQHGGYPVVGVNFGGRPVDQKRYRYRVDEIWGRTREALGRLALPGQDSPVGQELFEDLTQRQYGFTISGDKVSLESKSDMKKRGLRSPDLADALALTFAVDLAPLAEPALVQDRQPDHDYDPHANL